MSFNESLTSIDVLVIPSYLSPPEAQRGFNPPLPVCLSVFELLIGCSDGLSLHHDKLLYEGGGANCVSVSADVGP